MKPSGLRVLEMTTDILLAFVRDGGHPFPLKISDGVPEGAKIVKIDADRNRIRLILMHDDFLPMPEDGSIPHLTPRFNTWCEDHSKCEQNDDAHD